MFIFNDKFYKTKGGNYYTEEYLQHNGYISGNTWHCGNTVTEIFPAEEIRAEYGSGKVIRCNYSQLFRDNDNMVLCNNIANNIEDLELESGSDYDEEEDTYADIYQWFIIDDGLADSLGIHTDEIVYYHSGLDIYILGVTHCGTSWNYVGAEYKL